MTSFGGGIYSGHQDMNMILEQCNSIFCHKNTCIHTEKGTVVLVSSCHRCYSSVHPLPGPGPGSGDCAGEGGFESTWVAVRGGLGSAAAAVLPSWRWKCQNGGHRA